MRARRKVSDAESASPTDPKLEMQTGGGQANFSDVETYVPALMALGLATVELLAAALAPRRLAVGVCTSFLYGAVYMHYSDRARYHLTWTCMLGLNVWYMSTVVQGVWPDRTDDERATPSYLGHQLTPMCASNLVLKVVQLGFIAGGSAIAYKAPSKQRIAAFMVLAGAICQPPDFSIVYFGGVATAVARAALYSFVFASAYLTIDLHRIPPVDYGLRVLLSTAYALYLPIALAIVAGSVHIFLCHQKYRAASGSCFECENDCFTSQQQQQQWGTKQPALPSQQQQQQQSTTDDKLLKLLRTGGVKDKKSSLLPR